MNEKAEEAKQKLAEFRKQKGGFTSEQAKEAFRLQEVIYQNERAKQSTGDNTD